MKKAVSILVICAVLLGIFGAPALAADPVNVTKTITIPPGSYQTFSVDVGFAGSIVEIRQHSGDANVNLQQGVQFSGTQITGRVSGTVPSGQSSTQGVFILKTSGGSQIYLTVIVQNGAPQLSGGADVPLLVGYSDTSNTTYYNLTNISSSNESVAKASNFNNKLLIQGIAVGKATVSFDASTTATATPQRYTVSVEVKAPASNQPQGKSIPTSVSVAVGETRTYELNYDRVEFVEATGKLAYLINGPYAQISYTGGILSVKGITAGSQIVKGRYGLNSNSAPIDFPNFTVTVTGAAATPAPTPTATPVATPVPTQAPAASPAGGIVFGTRKNGATVSFTYKANQKVALSKDVKVDGQTRKLSDVYWVSTNPKVATVDTNGKITVKAKGTTNIIATSQDGAQTGYIKLQVK